MSVVQSRNKILNVGCLLLEKQSEGSESKVLKSIRLLILILKITIMTWFWKWILARDIGVEQTRVMLNFTTITNWTIP